MKKEANKNIIKYLVAGLAVVLLLLLAGYWYMQNSQQAPYEPGKTIEATGVVLDGNAGE